MKIYIYDIVDLFPVYFDNSGKDQIKELCGFTIKKIVVTLFNINC